MKKKICLNLLFAFILFFVAACATTGNKENKILINNSGTPNAQYLMNNHILEDSAPVVARIGKKIITLSEFKKDISDFMKTSVISYSDTYSLGKMLETFVFSKAIPELTIFLRLNETDTYNMLLEKYKMKLAMDMLEDHILKKSGVPTEMEISDYYLKNDESYSFPNKVGIKNILSDTRVEIEKVIDILKSGANLNKITADTSLKIKISDLGFIESGMLEEPLNKNALLLKPGEYSSVLKTKFGYHLLYCYKNQEGGKIPFNDAVKKEIYQSISKQRMRKELDKIIDDFKKENIYELYYNNLNLLDEKKKN